VPKALIVARYFAKEQEAITQLEAELESVAARLSELEEEHGGEEGVCSALDKVNKASVAARLKEIRGLFARDDEESREEATVLEEWLELSSQEAVLKKKLKDAEAALDAKAYAQYPRLTEAEIKTLVVDDRSSQGSILSSQRAKQLSWITNIEGIVFKPPMSSVSFIFIPLEPRFLRLAKPILSRYCFRFLHSPNKLPLPPSSATWTLRLLRSKRSWSKPARPSRA
jgi:hypothetical protein